MSRVPWNMSVRPVVACLLALACILPACSDDSVSPRPRSEAYPWSWVEVDSFATGGRVGAVYGTGPNDIFVATRGLERHFDGWNLSPVGNVVRYDGTTWSAPLHSFTASTRRLDLWASSPDDVYLADGRLEHYDGSTWRDAGINADVVTGTAADDIFAASDIDSLVSHFDGTRWSTIGKIHGQFDCVDIHAIPGPFVVVAHKYSIATWDGATWTETPFPDGRIEGVWAFAPDDVYGVGSSVVWHFDGATWSGMTVPQAGQLTGLWANGADDMYACGEYGIIDHYDGSAWRRVESGTFKSLWDIWGDGSGAVYAVGDDEEVVRVDAGGRESIWKHSPDVVSAVWGESTDRYAVTSRVDPGTVYLYDGGEWTEYYIAGDRYTGGIRSIAGTSLDDIYVLIDRMTYHFDGQSWSAAGALNADFPGTMWFASPTDGFAIGGGSIFQFDGDSWTEVVSGLPWSMRGIWGASVDAVYAINTRHLVYFYDGETWTSIRSPVQDATLIDICGVSADEVYVLTGEITVPLADRLFRWDGRLWHEIAKPALPHAGSLFTGAYNNIFVYGGCWLGHFDGVRWTTGCDAERQTDQIVRVLDGTVLQLRNNTVFQQVLE